MSRKPIHLVPRGEKVELELTVDRLSTRLVRGVFVADIIEDRHSSPPIFHWIIQRASFPEIIQSGQETSLREADCAAEAFLKQLARKRRRKSA